MKKPKVYILSGGTHRLIVAAANQRQAAQVFHVSVGYLRRNGGVCADEGACRVAMSKPGRVWRQKIDYAAPQPWLSAEGKP